jgi:hypothetical protein
LKQFNRLLVWPTLVLFIILAVSGYGITNSATMSKLTGGLLTHAVSEYLHVVLALPTLTLLMIHVLIAMRSTLTRWGVKEGRLLDSFLIVLGGFAMTLIVLMQYLVA